MARNAAGTYSRVVDDYVDGAVIRADDHNDEHDDFGAELTDSLNRSGKGGMLAALKLYDGTLASPGAHFTGQTNTGFYLAAAGDLRVALAASDIQKWTAALVRIETALTVADILTANELSVGSDGSIGGALAVTGAITGASLDVSGEAECGTLDCLGAGAVGGALTVAGNTSLGGSVAAWVASTAYVIGNQVIANGNIYTCDTNGTSAGSGTGPSGTGTNIADGTTQWDYVQAAPTLGVAGVATFRSQASFTFGADMTNDKIVNVADGSASGDAVNYGQLAAVIARLGSHPYFIYPGEIPPATNGFMPVGGTPANEDLYWIAPVAGTVDKLFVYHDTVSATVTTTYTVRKNGSDQALTCSIANTQSSGSDTSNSFSVAAGDRVSIRGTGGAGVVGPIDISATFRFTPS